MNNLGKKIEKLVNVAIIVAAVLLSVVLVKTYFLQKSVAAVEAGGIGVGTRLNLPEINFANDRHSILLALSTECRFCTESAPFYVRLGQGRANARLIALFPQPVQESGDYLKKIGVSVDEVKQFSSGSVGVTGTPTLILVDQKGIVTDVWKGKLTADKENEVLRKLAGYTLLNYHSNQTERLRSCIRAMRG